MHIRTDVNKRHAHNPDKCHYGKSLLGALTSEFAKLAAAVVRTGGDSPSACGFRHNCKDILSQRKVRT
jgi:hypothetical protein